MFPFKYESRETKQFIPYWFPLGTVASNVVRFLSDEYRALRFRVSVITDSICLRRGKIKSNRVRRTGNRQRGSRFLGRTICETSVSRRVDWNNHADGLNLAR